MSLNWTKEQEKAFNWKQNLCVTAGAGAGKTSVLSERYLRILLEDNNCEVFHILALTFTNKAANEMKGRLFKRLNEIAKEAQDIKIKKRIRKLRDDIPYAPISTIHSFCTGVLRDYSIEIGIDPLFSVLDQIQQNSFEQQAIDNFFDEATSNSNHPCFKYFDILTDSYTKSKIVKIIKRLFRLRPLSNQIILRDLTEENDVFQKNLDDDEKLFEIEHIKYVKAICEIFKGVIVKYDSLKGNGKSLDFADLEEKTMQLLKNNNIAKFLRKKYKYLLVDEFQDTNFIQWDILEKIAADNGTIDSGRLFIVGDPQQSIYSFRGADVRTFNYVRDQILSQNKDEKSKDKISDEIFLIDNYRSREGIIAFINYLFNQISQIDYLSFSPKKSKTNQLPCPKLYDEMVKKYKIGFGKLNSAKSFPESLPNKGTINFLVPDLNKKSPKNFSKEENFSEESINVEKKSSKEQLLTNEAKMVAAKIKEIVKENPIDVFDPTSPESDKESLTRKVRYSDIVILFRASGNCYAFEDALREYNIPFLSIISSGFYKCREINDVVNLIKLLSDQTLDIHLLSILRSPLFGFSDNLLMSIAIISDDKQMCFWDKMNLFINDKNSQKISEKNTAWITIVKDAIAKINKWKNLFNKISLSEFISIIFDGTGAWFHFAFGEDGDQRIANLNKLKRDIINFESANGIDFIQFVDEVVGRGYDLSVKEPEAPVLSEGIDAVLLSTIHAVKGLEFPIVFLADGSHQFNFGSIDEIFCDSDVGFGISIPDKNNNNLLSPSPRRNFISYINRAKTILEEQRLFYVALTRAKDHIFFSWHPRLKKGENFSYLRFIEDVFGSTFFDMGQFQIPFIWENKEYKINYFYSFSEPQKGADEKQILKNLQNICDEIDKIEIDNLKQNEFELPYMDSINPEKEDIKFAVTSLMTYCDCPRNYLLSKILGITKDILTLDDIEDTTEYFADELEEEIFNIPNVGIEFGILAHMLFSIIVKGQQVNVEQVFEKCLKRREIETGLVLGSFKERMMIAATNFLSSEIYAKICQSDFVETEYDFEMRLDEGRVGGDIDLLFKYNSEYQVIDYKTNNITHEQLEQTAKYYELQMLIYSLFVMKNFNQEKVNASLYFTSLGEFFHFYFVRKNIHLYEKRINGIIENIRLGKFEPNFSDKCKKCCFSNEKFCNREK